MFTLLLLGTAASQHVGGSQMASDGARLQSAAGGDKVCRCVQGEKGEPGERGNKGNPGESVCHLPHLPSAISAVEEG